MIEATLLLFIYRNWLLLNASFFPGSFTKNMNTFLFLTTWLKVCNLPNYNNLHDFFRHFSLQQYAGTYTIQFSLHEDLGFNLKRAEGFRLFLSLMLVTRPLTFFLFSTTHFTFLTFFQVNILILIQVHKKMSTLVQPMVEDKHFRQIRWDLKSAFYKLMIVNKIQGKQHKAM